jgi:5-methylthioadenosine/S-adenosylhomocysteine deaminase
VNISTSHNAPRFRRDPGGLYAQLVYAAKSTDVTDVMVNGRWLMRDRRLLNLDEAGLIQHAEEYSRKIDQFLIKREQSVLSKLIAIDGATETETFEVQAKVRIEGPDHVLAALEQDQIEILRFRHYHEYDTYFSFPDPEQGYLRYREDEFIDNKNQVETIRYRLTLIGPARELRFPGDVVLSRSRFIAPATHSLRFYREYFNPSQEISINKDRLRWRILFRGMEYFVNLDRLDKPDLGSFLEVKSRTWSRRDAEYKAQAAQELLEILGIPRTAERVVQEYVKLV